jgi:hypothetical protein
MKWIEITLSTNPHHEKNLDVLHGIFSETPRDAAWTPHLSLAYDNPDSDSPLSTVDAAHEVVQCFPTLLSRTSRKVTSLRLWSTYGRLDQWECLDTIHLS